MRAASAFSSSGSGLSVAAAAFGSRKSIFATAGSISRPRRDEPLLQNGSMQESSLSPRTTHVLGRLRHARLWLLLVLGSVAIVLVPWTAYLSATLPSEHVTHHWQVAWAGFDLFEAAALVATFLAMLKRSAFVTVAASVAG